MTTRLLPIVRDNAYLQLADLIPLLERGEVGQYGEIVEKIVKLFRVAGICSLLLDCSVTSFVNELQKGAAAYAHALPMIDEANQATSTSSGFYCAVACGDEQAAEAISRSSRAKWNPDLEHEDDFLFTRFLMDCFFLRLSERKLRETVEALEQVTKGEDSPRRDICAAILARDAEAFDAALQGHLLERHEFVTDSWHSGNILEEDWSTDGHVFVEGIAIVRLAKLIPIETQEEYLYVPSIVLQTKPVNARPDSWRSASQPSG